MPAARNFFTDAEKQTLLGCIRAAEKQTSGEIRLHLEETCGQQPFQRGVKVFNKLAMHQTQHRNGVLFYVAVKDRQFAIVADEGINRKVPPNFWDDISHQITRQFAKGEFLLGLIQGIEQAAQQLQAHFPLASNDRNELSDDISYED